MLANILVVCLASLAWVAANNGGKKNDLVKDLGYQKIRGRNNGTLDLYLGVRYGSADRFQLPHVPEKNRSSIYSATTLGPSCWQFSGGATPGAPNAVYKPGSEDCLLLNVVVPAGTTEKSQLPVLFYIHGGGFHNGGIDQTASNSGAGIPNFEFVRKYPKFVYVEIQYRLGPHGFLAGKEIKEGGSLNLGLYDQQFALRWVQEHIHKFGGNSSHVTLWGHSAGGGSILQHTVANNGSTQTALGLEKPLFHAVLGNSVFEQLLASPTDAKPQGAYQALVSAAGCGSSNNTLKCLADIEEEDFYKASLQVAQSQYQNSFIWTPTVDGSLIVEAPAKLLAKGRLNTHRIMATSDLNEATAFVPFSLLNTGKDSDLDDFIRAWWPGATDTITSQIKTEYAVADYPTANNTFLRGQAMWTDGIFQCPTYRLARGSKDIGYKTTFSVFPAAHTADAVLFWDSIVVQVSIGNDGHDFVGSYYGWFVHGDPNKNPLSSTGPSWQLIKQNKEVVFDVQRTDNTEFNPYNTMQAVDATLKLLTTGDFGVLASSFGTPDNLTTVESEPMYLNARCDFWQDLYLDN